MKKLDQQNRGLSLVKIDRLLTDFVIAFVVILVVSLIVTFLYNLLVYRTSVVDGESSFRLALILGISRSFLKQLDKR